MRIAATLAATLLLAGCGDPAWRNPAASHGSTALPSDVARIAGAQLVSVSRPSTHTDHLSSETLPGPPDWAAGLIGKRLPAVYPAQGACLGNTDGVKLRYDRGAGGTRLRGWAWDPATKAAVPRVVLVDVGLVIRGAGETGARRKDVPRAVPTITSDYAGWEAVTPISSGPLDTYGVLADGRTTCKLGHVEL